MRSIFSVSVDSQLLAEARGMHLPLSKIAEEAIRNALNKPLTKEEKEIRSLDELGKVKKLVYNLSGLYPDIFKKAVRAAKYRGMKTETTEQKIVFWREVVKLVGELKESPPAPPQEKGVTTDENAP